MKQTALSRRAFLLGLGAVSSAALLSACNTNAPVNSGPTPSLRMKFVTPRLTLYNPRFVTYITSNADFCTAPEDFFIPK